MFCSEMSGGDRHWFRRRSIGKEKSVSIENVIIITILRCILRKWDVGVWTGSSWLMIGTGDGHL